MQLDKVIKDRHSCKKFKNKKPDWRDIIKCIDITRFTPMAGNIFTPRFILVDDKEKIKNLAEAAQQEFISKVDYVIVVCSECSLAKNTYNDRAERYCRQQAGASIQNLLLKIEDKGLSTCWIGHFVDMQVREILKIPEDFLIEAILPIGFEYSVNKRREKISLDSILYFNKFGNIKMKNPKRLYV
jgi:nitroreductase